MKIILGADHRGQELKEAVINQLQELEVSYEDISLHPTPEDDYVDFAEKVGRQVESDIFGILICGSGIGMVVAANKMKQVRAGMGATEAQIKAGREDDDMNVLVLASDFQSPEDVKPLVSVFLSTPFVENERHVRRLEKITLLEERETV